MNCQESSRDAPLETQRITLEEALEANRANARSATPSTSLKRRALDRWLSAHGFELDRVGVAKRTDDATYVPVRS